MSAAMRICVRPLADLLEENSKCFEDFDLPKHQLRDEHMIPIEQLASEEQLSPKEATIKKSTRRKKDISAATTSKKAKAIQQDGSLTKTATARKSVTTKKLKKVFDERQKTIDFFFKSSSKNYHIEPLNETNGSKKPTKHIKSRRRIVYNDKDKSDTSVSNESKFILTSSMRKKINIKPSCTIDLLDDSGDEENKSVNGNDKLKDKSVKSQTKDKKHEVGKNPEALLQSANCKTTTKQNQCKSNMNAMITKSKESEENEPNRSCTVKGDYNVVHTKKPKRVNRRILSESDDEETVMSKNATDLELSGTKKKTSKKRNHLNKIVAETEQASNVRKVKYNTRKVNEIRQNSLLDNNEGDCEQAIRCHDKTTQNTQAKENKRNDTHKSQQNIENDSNDNFASSSGVDPKTLMNVFHTPPETFQPSVLESSRATTSKTPKLDASLNAITHKSNKENVVLETPSLTTTPLFTSTSAHSDSIVISDDDFENVPSNTKIKSSKTITSTSSIRKTKSRTKTSGPTTAKRTKKPPPPHPPYKVIEGTNGTMAVDAFRFGDIAGVKHYFLTHFHADHYIGLTRKFSHDLYMSSITARLVRAFIPIEEQYIKELELNSPIKIDDIEVTAIDANHCPGAIMLVFKLPDGRCILHTGDFRACADMESEPIFWNNDIHTIYLDTTYISKNYAFCHQTESIDRAKYLTNEFIEKNVGTRILFVCGAYLIGKEKFWSALATHFGWKVYAEGNRQKALAAQVNKKLNSLLTDNPLDAQMHVIPLQKLNYASLLEYQAQYAENFDLIFALRPSGWEKNSRPQYRGKVNIIGIEYSEHSSHDEMKRFVQYLKPQNVISTVPVNSNPAITAKIPQNWYKYTKLLQRQYQPSITSFFKMKPDKYYLQLTEKTKKSFKQSGYNDTMQQVDNVDDEQFISTSPELVRNQIERNDDCKEIKKPKDEVLARVPNITAPIVIDSDTDDDWLT